MKFPTCEVIYLFIFSPADFNLCLTSRMRWRPVVRSSPARSSLCSTPRSRWAARAPSAAPVWSRHCSPAGTAQHSMCQTFIKINKWAKSTWTFVFFWWRQMFSAQVNVIRFESSWHVQQTLPGEKKNASWGTVLQPKGREEVGNLKKKGKEGCEMMTACCFLHVWNTGKEKAHLDKQICESIASKKKFGIWNFMGAASLWTTWIAF